MSARAIGSPLEPAAAAMPRAICAHLATSFIWYRRRAQTAAMSSRRPVMNDAAAGPKPPSSGGCGAPGSGK